MQWHSRLVSGAIRAWVEPYGFCLVHYTRLTTVYDSVFGWVGTVHRLYRIDMEQAGSEPDLTEIHIDNGDWFYFYMRPNATAENPAPGKGRDHEKIVLMSPTAAYAFLSQPSLKMAETCVMIIVDGLKTRCGAAHFLPTPDDRLRFR